MQEIRVEARAKINLYLKVTGKRPDGYHDLITVMQSISLSDTLCVRRVCEQVVSVDAGGLLPDDESNLVTRAARAYFKASGAPFGVRVTLEKRIPMAAGLGGGSADAAAMLKALNRLDGDRFDEDRLVEIAATVGADVPFCLVGGTRLCRGIGERMERVENNLNGTLVVAIGEEGVSTPRAFAALDERCGDFSGVDPAAPQALLDAMQSGELSVALPQFYNMFEEVIEPIRPGVSECKSVLLSCGAAKAMMSGSGPSVWGIFEKEADAERAVESLIAVGKRAYLCHMTK